MKQILGPKKHARCERLAGRLYARCLTRGGWGHGALCYWPDPAHPTEPDEATADWVDYQHGTVTPAYRGGQWVIPPAPVYGADGRRIIY
jgi:hypothetical protein